MKWFEMIILIFENVYNFMEWCYKRVLFYFWFFGYNNWMVNKEKFFMFKLKLLIDENLF